MMSVATAMHKLIDSCRWMEVMIRGDENPLNPLVKSDRVVYCVCEGGFVSTGERRLGPSGQLTPCVGNSAKISFKTAARPLT